jgi:hypothetical protein
MNEESQPTRPKALREALATIYSIVRAFQWGEPKWTTNDAYEKDRADFMAGVACGEEGVTGTLEVFAQGALDSRFAPRYGGQIHARRFAECLTGADCPATSVVPDWVQCQLEWLAARGDSEAAAPEASSPSQIQ